MKKKYRPIAIYLPQYHPIPENDMWWGKGFTEWRNVVQARPRFNNHYQPHIPADLGFYDLRLQETQIQQANLAKQYGIEGFCYYHYWFNGKLLLEKPLQNVLNSKQPDFPFMMCWANENWTRMWDGGNNQILIEQKYSIEDDKKHIKYLLPYFKDNRYIKIDGKAVFAIYKPDLFPDIKKTIEIFKSEAKKHNIDLYLCAFERNAGMSGNEFINIGFDAVIDFQPISKTLKRIDSSTIERLKNFKAFDFLYRKILKINPTNDKIIDYKTFINKDIEFFKERNYKLFPGFSPMWDNTSRRKKQQALIFKNSTPELFKYWIQKKLSFYKPASQNENLVFFNAWNEWAEGCHLEPCLKWQHKYLQVVKDIFDS